MHNNMSLYANVWIALCGSHASKREGNSIHLPCPLTYALLDEFIHTVILIEVGGMLALNLLEPLQCMHRHDTSSRYLTRRILLIETLFTKSTSCIADNSSSDRQIATVTLSRMRIGLMITVAFVFICHAHQSHPQLTAHAQSYRTAVN